MNISRVNLLASLVSALTILISVSAKAQSYPPVWNNTSKYGAGDMVTDYGNVYRCIKAVTAPYMDPSKTYANWELNYVRNNTTLVIGVEQPFPTVVIAWTYAENCIVAQGVYLHLSISTADGLYSASSSTPLNLDHGSGARISLIGDNPANITLTFPHSDGILIDSGHAFSLISNVTVTGGATNFGIHALGNACIANVENVNINNFVDGVHVEDGANLNLAASVLIAQCSNSGCLATKSASITIASGLSYGDNGTGGSTYGFTATVGGRISAEGAAVRESAYGVDAEDGGIVDISNGQEESNNTGVYATNRGYVKAANVYLKNGVDIAVSLAGVVNANGTPYNNASTVGSNDGSYILQ